MQGPALGDRIRSDRSRQIWRLPDCSPVQYCLSAETIAIGRSARADNDIVLETDSLCSKRHAAIEKDGDGRYTLYDLGSTNGSKVNGQRVDNRTLCDGDKIQLGQTRLLFEQKMPAGTAAQTAKIFDTPKGHLTAKIFELPEVVPQAKLAELPRAWTESDGTAFAPLD